MPRPLKPVANPSLELLYENLQKAYMEWKNCPGGYEWLAHDRRLAMRGAASERIDDPIFLRVKSAYDNFDQAIFKLIRRNKRAIGDPRIIERISQAELPWFGDIQFFNELGDALKENVGMHAKTAKRVDIAELYPCADEYRKGNDVALKERYKFWENFDIESRRRARPNDAAYQAMVDNWERRKYSIIGGVDGEEGGYKAFKERVKALANALNKRGVPPVSVSKKTSQ